MKAIAVAAVHFPHTLLSQESVHRLRARITTHGHVVPTGAMDFFHEMDQLAIFQALFASKLTYGTASAWLMRGDMRSLDGLQARCIRQISASYVSRVSNKRVLAMADVDQIPTTIRHGQPKLLGSILREPDKRVLRDVMFPPRCLIPITQAFSEKCRETRHII